MFVGAKGILARPFHSASARKYSRAKRPRGMVAGRGAWTRGAEMLWPQIFTSSDLLQPFSLLDGVRVGRQSDRGQGHVQPSDLQLKVRRRGNVLVLAHSFSFAGLSEAKTTCWRKIAAPVFSREEDHLACTI